MKNFVKYFCLIVFLLSAFLLMINTSNTQAALDYPFDGVIVSTDLLAVIHNAANYNTNSEIDELINGTKVKVVGKSGSLYKITYGEDKEGYVASSLVKSIAASTLTTNANGVEPYEDYCNMLVKEGFDKSYCPYLYYIHSNHPKWVFKADVNNYTLEEAAKKEEENVSLQTVNKTYWYYENNQPKINEKSAGRDYYFINSSVIASLLDPRNSLYDGIIFQFLNLEKNTDAINEDAIVAITGEKGNLRKFTNEFIKAASSLNINALHLIARSTQEGANKEGYAPTTGTYTKDTGTTNPDGKTLDGFYNFYNMGAYVEKDKGYTSSIQRGLAYAAGYIDGDSYGRPWDTAEKAVLGGGQWIGSLYVKRAQNTNYFQKYNVSNKTSTPFGHQYMTNGAAPLLESNSMFKAYTAGNLLDTDFEFLIPVYKDMPSDGYQATLKDSNSSLSSITVDDKVITGFDSSILEYNYNASTNANSVKVGAKTLVSTSTVKGTGNYNFVDNKVSVSLVVTAEDGTTTTYKVNITKVTPQENVKVTDIVSKMGVKISGDYMYGISPDTSATSLLNTVTKNKGKASIVDSSLKAKTSGSLATGDKITINGTNDSKTYTIAVRGDVNGDGAVKINDLILIQSHILGKNILKNEKVLAADINYDSNIKINDLILVQSNILGKNTL